MIVDFRCPCCGNKMHQESQTQSVMGISSQFNHDSKEWQIPNQITVEFIKTFWCKNTGCQMKNKFVFHDGNYKYALEKKD